MRLVVIGLSLSSSWGNGHATTYRALLAALHARGHDILFLEQDAPWYAPHRDLSDPDFARLELYASPADARGRFTRDVAEADAVIVGSYVPEGVEMLDWARDVRRGALAFYDIDTPVTLARLDRGDHLYLAPRQIGDLDLYLSFTGGPTLERLESELGARRARALYCSVDVMQYRPQRRASRTWLLGYLGTYSEDRQPALDRLLTTTARSRPGSQFVVAGAQYPSTIDWPANVARLEHVPPERHQGFYNDQDFALNVTRADMVAAGWSPSVRLFEAAACGVPVISDRWAGLEALFPDGGVLIADEARDVETFLDMGEAERSRHGEAALACAHDRHSSERRARELELHLEAASRGAAAEAVS